MADERAQNRRVEVVILSSLSAQSEANTPDDLATEIAGPLFNPDDFIFQPDTAPAIPGANYADASSGFDDPFGLSSFDLITPWPDTIF